MAKRSSGMKMLMDSYQLKLGILIFIVLVSSAMIYSSVEDVPLLEALFVSVIMLLGEPTDPVTNIGKASVLVTMVAGIIFFAFIIGEFSSYVLERIINRGKVKVVKRYSGSGHIIIFGAPEKLEGVMRELRSDALEHHLPVLVISPNAAEISFSDDSLKHDVRAIVGEPLDEETLERANLPGARSILVLSTDETMKGGKMYRDAYVSLAYNTVYNHLTRKDVAPLVKGDINVVLEFLDESNNLLPCARGEGNEPEVYTTEIPGTGKTLTVEPIYLENMPRYLFIQSILEREINTVVQELVNSQGDTCEFYYHAVEENLAGKSFHSVEGALLDTGVTPIGVLRPSSLDSSMAVSGYRGVNRIELILNPETELKLARGDRLVLISYNEADARKALEDARTGKSAPASQKPKAAAGTCGGGLGFNRIFMVNWNPGQARQMLTEMSKICAEASGSMEIVIISKHSPRKIEAELEPIKKAVQEALGRPIDELINIRAIQAAEPIPLRAFREAGITRESAAASRVLILSDSEEDSDIRALHQLQTIENRISDEVFTAVELTDSRNYHYFRNTRADVIVSIDAFAEQLMAQALLKPYVSLVFRNLLTFSDDTNEFYLRDVPASMVGKPYRELQRALIGQPIILIGHVRPVPKMKGKPANPSVTLNPRASGTYDDTGRLPRILKSEPLRKGDRVILVARTPEMVDAVLDSMK